MNQLKIIFIQLPDINKYSSLPEQYDDYGRFGLFNNGGFYYLGLMSSHLPNTKIGGYWASDKQNNILYISPRNTGIDEEFMKMYDILLNTGQIGFIINRAGLKQ